MDFDGLVGTSKPVTRKPTSKRKIEANRKNALRSTGPKTARGKAFVARNAIKHGILVSQIMTTELEQNEFESLIQALFQEDQPVGRSEELLVERIANCWWRLRRVQIAEDGEAAKGRLGVVEQFRSDSFDVYVGKWQVMQAERLAGENGEHKAANWSRETAVADQELIKNLRRSPMGIHVICRGIREFKDEVGKNGMPSEKSIFRLLNCVGHDWILELPSDESWKIPERRKRFLDRLDTEIEYLEKLVQNIEFEQRLNREAQVSITSLPPEQAANRILRYEAHIERQLNHALDQLERVQRRRRGEVIAPPLKVEV